VKKICLAGIILAAGSSSRMKTPKALLKINDRTFLEEIYAKMSPFVKEVIVVVGADKDEILSKVNIKGAKIVYNENYERGMFSSVKKGLSAIASAVGGFVLNPVDCPLVMEKTYKDILRFHGTRPFCISVPSYKGKRGHPVIFPEALIKEIISAPDDAEKGLNYFIKNHEKEVCVLNTNDKGVIININTPEVYESQLGGSRRRSLTG